jgi:hypothetical protein
MNDALRFKTGAFWLYRKEPITTLGTTQDAAICGPPNPFRYRIVAPVSGIVTAKTC